MTHDSIAQSPDSPHPELQVLADLLSGEIEYDVLLSRVIPHLVARCDRCRGHVETIDKLLERFDHWNESIVVRESADAPRLITELMEIPRGRRFGDLNEREYLHTWGVCQLLLQRCRSSWIGDPEGALEMAEMAVMISEQLPREVYHPEWVRDLGARSWAYLGNTRRLVNELRSADNAFQRALRELSQGTGRARVEAEILDLLASLRFDQRNLEEARNLQGTVVRIWHSENQPNRCARALLAQARTLQEMGDVEAALVQLQQVTIDLEVAHEPRLLRCVEILRLQCLLDSGRPHEARQRLSGIADHFANAPKPDRVRLRWNEGQIAHALARGADAHAADEWAEAEAAFREVQQHFVERGRPYDTALVSLDLALVLAEQGHFEQVAEVAAEILPVFRAQGVAREAMASWLLLREAIKSRTLTVELVEEMRHLVARRRP